MPLKIYGYQKPTVEFWTKTFEKNTLLHKPDEFFLSIILKYISKTNKILDGGCGLGHIAIYLSSLGYDITGIDFSKMLIRKVRRYEKEVAAHVGDVVSLPYRENTFDTYISLGVFEHFEEGPQLALSEAYRILKKGGNLIITVPYVNPLRRLRRLFFRRYHYLGQSDREGFFEYAFTKKEITTSVKDAGFKVMETEPISPLITLELELFGMKNLINKLLRNFLPNEKNVRSKITIMAVEVKKGSLHNVILNLFKRLVRSRIFRGTFSHMLLVIAQKSQGAN